MSGEIIKEIKKMETRNLKEISRMDSLALTSVLNYWKDYDPMSVLLAYGELKRRIYDIPESLTKKQNQFCEKNSAPNIEVFLNTSMKEIGFNSYEEYFYFEFHGEYSIHQNQVLLLQNLYEEVI